jgi:hypothetical protein
MMILIDILQVIPDISFGNLLSTKKYSIGCVPFKNRIDRLNHDKGPDFFRSSLETQRKLKDERLSNVAKVDSWMLIDCVFLKQLFITIFMQVAFDQRQRSLPEHSNSSISSNIKTDFANSRFASGIPRPSFAKMYEFIDSSLETKLAQMVNEAVLSRMQADGKMLSSENEQQFVQKNPTEEKTSPRNPKLRPSVISSMSPAPQPIPRMHSRPLEYSSPAPHFSDISSLGNSPDYSSPSTFANIALGWQDTMGLPINDCGKDSPITKALKQLTYHLEPSNVSSPDRSSQGIAAAGTIHQQPYDEYSQMIEATFAALSPRGISPKDQHYSINSQTTQIQSYSTSNPSSRTLSYRQLHVKDLYPESTTGSHKPSYESLENSSVPSAVPNRTVLFDPFCAFATELADSLNLEESSNSPHVLPDPKTTRPTTTIYNLFEAIQEPDDDTVAIKFVTLQDANTNLQTFPQRHHGRNVTDKYDMIKDMDKTLDASLPGHTQSSDVVVQKAPTPLSPTNAFQDGSASETDNAMLFAELGKLSQVERIAVLPTATAREQPQHTRQKFEQNDSFSNISAKIAIRKQEVIALEEGIDSIRGISELLEIFTSVPSAAKKHSPHNSAANRTSFLADSKIKDELPRASLSERFSSQAPKWTHAPSDVEQKQQQDVAGTSAEKRQPLLPDIEIIDSSPAQAFQNANIVANIIRDALPVPGLDLSQNDSDVDEAAISGDDSGVDGDGDSDGEGMWFV